MGSENAGAFDQREFRDALGTFVTGVTVVTTRGADGEPAGMAVNSFNSVSLDPPLILWSIAHTASAFSVFETADRFAVHVLTVDQQNLSDRFAFKEDRFTGLELDEGLGGVPLLRECAACFECRTEARHPGGDHVILIGRVERFTYEQRPPLLYVGGKYARIADAPDG